MAKRGRKPSPGARYASGRLKPVRKIDRGTERTQAAVARFGVYRVDALGRAFATGMLGTDAGARVLLDTGRRMAEIYRGQFEHGRIGCALADRGAHHPEDVARALADDRWLTARLAAVRAKGLEVRRSFEALVLHEHPDSGPDWLDNLIDGRAGARDWATLARAVEGLEAAV